MQSDRDDSPQLECLIEDDRWTVIPFMTLAQTAASAVLSHLNIAPSVCEISILACNDARIAALNAEFREKPGPTNVLSWPRDDLSADTPGARPHPPQPDPDGLIELGDIAIAYETCVSEAGAGGKTLQDHVTHLIVHGLLHLLGYDHIRDQDATLMEALETEILGNMGVDDPYKDDSGTVRSLFGMD